MPTQRVYRSLIGLTLIRCAPGCMATRVKWFGPDYAVPLRCSAVQLDTAESLYARALEAEQRGSDTCVDLFFQVAVKTCDHDRPSCRQCRQRRLHRSALMKLVAISQRHGRFDPHRGLQIHHQGRPVWIPITYQGFVWQPHDFDCMAPVGHYTTNAFRYTHRRPGVGVPLVVTRCCRNANDFLPDRSIFAATLKLDAGGCGESGDCSSNDQQISQCRLLMYDPLRVDHTSTSHGRLKIAKDISAPLAYRLRNQEQTILQNSLNVDASDESRLYMIEPYQTGKIPVVLVHGLLADPFTWIEMVNQLRAEPGFVQHFQLWVFEYPTGQAFLASAAGLRRRLDTALRTFDPTHQDYPASNMVLVGHSMGGLISKLQITSSGDLLWRSVSNRPFDQVVMSDQTRQELTSTFFFEPSRHVGRVVFMGTPHGGSGYSQRLIGRLASSLVSQSQESEQTRRQLIANNPGVFSKQVQRRIPTSIDLLDPRSELLNAISRLPIRCRARMHSVIGDSCSTLICGRSDGVVRVDSAREPNAISERVISTTHGTLNDHPESIQEVIRILRQHLHDLRHQHDSRGIAVELKEPHQHLETRFARGHNASFGVECRR